MRFVLVLVAALTAACGSSQENGTPAQDSVAVVTLTTDASSYAPGGQVNLRLRNAGQRTYLYNLCPSQVQRRDGGSWVPFQAAAEVCTMELRQLGPAGEATFAFRLRQDAPAGEYRVQAQLEDEAAKQRIVVSSPTFAITSRR